MAGANSGDTEPIGSDGSPGSFSPATENPKHVSAMADAESGDPERTGADASPGNAGESSALVRPSRYELQKLRDWKSFRRYLNNHEPPLSLPTCSGVDVVEFLKHLDQVGKTKIHLTGCAFFGHPKPPAPCDCPLKQSWGNLDSLVYRLRALYEEKGCNPGSNPFGTSDVQAYLREVRQYQAKARGIDYGKKRKQPLPALPAAPEGGATDSSDPSCTSHSNYIYGYATGGAMIPKTQNQFMPNRKDLGQYVPIWIRPPDLPIQYWAGTMLNSIPNKVGTQEKASEDACEAPDPEEEHTPTVRQNAKERTSTGETPKGILKKTRPRPDTGSQRSDPHRPSQANEVIELPVAVIAPICASGIDGSRVFSWKDDKVASLIISKIQLHIGSTELGYPIINKERFNTELEALEQKGEKWSNPWFLSLLDDTLRGLPRPLRGSEVKVNRPYECCKVRWLDPVETVLGKIDG